MSNSFVIDKDYQQRVADLVLAALMTGLKDEETGVALWRVGEIVNALKSTQAMLLAGSDLTASPTKAREYFDEFAKSLRRQTQHFRDHFAKHGAPFPTYTVEGDMH